MLCNDFFLFLFFQSNVTFKPLACSVQSIHESFICKQYQYQIKQLTYYCVILGQKSHNLVNNNNHYYNTNTKTIIGMVNIAVFSHKQLHL